LSTSWRISMLLWRNLISYNVSQTTGLTYIKFQGWKVIVCSICFNVQWIRILLGDLVSYYFYCNGEVWCFLCGTDQMFKCYSDKPRLRRVKLGAMPVGTSTQV
jgi:hypothetical protein